MFHHKLTSFLIIAAQGVGIYLTIYLRSICSFLHLCRRNQLFWSVQQTTKKQTTQPEDLHSLQTDFERQLLLRKLSSKPTQGSANRPIALRGKEDSNVLNR